MSIETTGGEYRVVVSVTKVSNFDHVGFEKEVDFLLAYGYCLVGPASISAVELNGSLMVSVAQTLIEVRSTEAPQGG